MAMSLNDELELEQKVREFIWNSDTQPALMVSKRPCRIAVYSVDIDGVVMLWMPEWYVEASGLAVGDRLVSVNVYGYHSVPDVFVGRRVITRFSPLRNIHPTVASFVSDDSRRIAELMSFVGGRRGWQRCAELAARYLAAHPARARHGHPALSGTPDSAIDVCGTVGG